MKPNQDAIAVRNTPFYWISKDFLRRHSPTWRAILAYNALAYYAKSDTAACENFSLKTLAQIVNISKDSMRRGLEELEEKGIIAKTRRTKKTGSGKRMPLPTLYTILAIKNGEPI